MHELPANIYSVASVREMDRTAIEDNGIPGYTLMTRAGAAAVTAALQRFPDAQRWQIVCGSGNNAGDGYVVARLAREAGINVSLLSLIDTDRLVGDAAKACNDYVAEGGTIAGWQGALDENAELLVDAMLGSGLQRDVGGDLADAVAAINAHPAKVMALDIPTGIQGDTGKAMGVAVEADLTMTFVGLKSGLFLRDGPNHCGELLCDGLQIPANMCAEPPLFRRPDGALIRKLLPRRPRDAHKGDFGHVLVVGGGAGMPGAVRLCGEAALRVGSGLVSIATDPSHAALLSATRPELMSHAIEQPADLEPLLARADVIAFGPGLGQSPWASELFDLLRGNELPAVWDADALNWLAQLPDTCGHRIITPHPGEAARLLDTTTADVQEDRPKAATALAQGYGGIAVLKGAKTLVAGDGDDIWMCTSGNPGMAAPGMGDVLTGVIAGLLAQGLTVHEAALVGVEVHARAGDRAAGNAERGLLASDLLAALRDIVNP
ncbi:MAG: NAD(P)H-hydrate dehydratase [Gammaproteobacteria bacterium]|nr:NAD(P)H-hydrate dehydratase [Gammaproteobacteria bacterium]